MNDDMLDQRTRHRLEDLQDIVKQDAKLIQNLRREIEKLRARSVLIPESVQKIIDNYPAVCAERDRMREALQEFNLYVILESDKDTDTRPVLVRHLRRARLAPYSAARDGVTEKEGGANE